MTSRTFFPILLAALLAAPLSQARSDEALEAYASSREGFLWEVPDSYPLEDGGLALARRDIARERLLAESARAGRLHEDPETAAALEAQRLRVAREMADRWLRNAASVSDEEVRQRYEEEKDRYVRPAEARFQFLFVRVEGPDDEEAARQRIDVLRQRALEGEPFHQLVIEQEGLDPEEHGEEQVTLRGRPGQYSEVIDEAIFSLPAGKISEPLRSRHGWHVVHVLDRREEEVIPFEQREVTIRARLLSEKRTELRQDKEVELLEKFPLEWTGLPDAPEDAEGEQAAAVAPPEDHVLATLGDTEFTAGEAAPRLGTTPEEAGEEDWRNAVEVLALPHRLLAWAEEEGWTAEPFFRERLSHRRNQVLALAYRDHLLAGIEVRDEEIDAYYEQNQGSLMAPAEYEVRELFHTAPTGEEIPNRADLYLARERIQDRMERIRERLAAGENLEQLSEDMPEEMAGLLVTERGWAPQGPRGRLLDTAVADLEPGEYSSVVESRRGFHVFLLEDHRPPRPMTREEAADRIERLIRAERGNAMVRELVETVDEELSSVE